MNKKYAVVLWSDEPNNFSYVKISRIQYDSSLITGEEHLLDQMFEIQVDKSSPETCTAKVLRVGSRAKMSRMAMELANEAMEEYMLASEDTPENTRSKRLTKKRKAVGSDQQKPEPIPSTSNAVYQQQSPISELHIQDHDPEGVKDQDGATAVSFENLDQPENRTLAEQNRVIEELRSKLRKKERRISKLKRDLAQFQPDQVDTVDVGERFMVSIQIIQELKSDFRHNPGVFLRKLMERSNLFTLEEIAGSSVNGQKHRDGSQRPRLNVQRFNLCKDFTIKKCKLKENTTRMLQFNKSIANICTDARKRLRTKTNAS